MARTTATSVRLATICVVLVSAASLGAAFLPAQNPPWAANYTMVASTITMACNTSGWFDASLGSKFGIVSYDWSNTKAQWANARPMDCEQRLVTQAQMTKAQRPDANVFVYRNLVKALPWFSSVRAKLDDPAYSGFFLKFKPGGSLPNGSYHVPACTGSKCSVFYHDQEQTPEQPSKSDPHPDGACKLPCDCGSQPCGEYLWDHRNGTMLREFLVNEFVMGATGVGNAAIDGLFIDDYWCSDLLNASCTDPVQGPSEINKYSQVDMGLSDEDILAITRGWLDTMTAAQAAMLAHGAYTWSLMPGQANANASPLMVTQATCATVLRTACDGDSPQPWLSAPLVMGVTPGHNASDPLPQLAQDLAAFLLMRGPHAYIGYGVWGMSWPTGISFDSHGGPRVPLPPSLQRDYGRPLARCKETGAGTGVFVRQWTGAKVQLDCNTWQATIDTSSQGH